MYSGKHDYHRLDVAVILRNRLYGSAWNLDFSVVHLRMCIYGAL